MRGTHLVSSGNISVRAQTIQSTPAGVPVLAVFAERGADGVLHHSVPNLRCASLLADPALVLHHSYGGCCYRTVYPSLPCPRLLLCTLAGLVVAPLRPLIGSDTTSVVPPCGEAWKVSKVYGLRQGSVFIEAGGAVLQESRRERWMVRRNGGTVVTSTLVHLGAIGVQALLRTFSVKARPLRGADSRAQPWRSRDPALTWLERVTSGYRLRVGPIAPLLTLEGDPWSSGWFC